MIHENIKNTKILHLSSFPIQVTTYNNINEMVKANIKSNVKHMDLFLPLQVRIHHGFSHR